MAMKKELAAPPTLMAPAYHVKRNSKRRKPSISYLSSTEASLGVLLAQTDEQGKERPVYYLSRVMLLAETRYPKVERMCLALVFTAHKLRQTMLSHPVHLITKSDPIRYFLSQPVLSGRSARWLLK